MTSKRFQRIRTLGTLCLLGTTLQSVASVADADWTTGYSSIVSLARWNNAGAATESVVPTVTLATQASVSMINNRGNLGAVLSDLGSSSNMRGLVTAMVTGGVLGGLNFSPTGQPTLSGGAQSFSSQLGQNLQAGVARSLISSAINGTSVEDGLKNAIFSALIDTAAAQGAFAIGQNGPQGRQALNAFVAELAHAMAGCAAGAASASTTGGHAGGGCSAGAIGAVVGHLSAQYLDPNATGGGNTVQLAGVISGVAAAVAGLGATGINQAASAGSNAVANNWLQPKEQEQRRAAQRTCDAGNSNACAVVRALSTLDAQREAGNDGTLYRGITQGLMALLLSPVTVPVELINSIVQNDAGDTVIALLRGVALLPTNIVNGLQSDDPEVRGRAMVDALAITAGAAAVTRAGVNVLQGGVRGTGVAGANGGVATGTVFDSIKATQPTYPGSAIPRSFEMTLPNGQSVWVAGNATEHMAEFAQMKAISFPPEAVRLASQQQLASLQGAVNTATQNGVAYNQILNVGGWELKFAPPRQPGQLPSLIHALQKH